jgi:peptide/nickel transport system permease protein
MSNENSTTSMNPPGGVTRKAPSVGQLIISETRANESYFQLVWRRFRRSPASIVGGVMVLVLVLLAVFAEFFATKNIYTADLNSAYMPPMQMHFIDAQGHFHLTPFVYKLANTLNATTFQVYWTEDTSQIYRLQFFVHSWKYKFFGLIPTDLHLIGVEKDGYFYMLGTDGLGRDLWGKACQAGRVSLSMSLFGTIISILVGSVLGIASGYYGGVTDNALQRFTEFVNAFPQLPLWMALAAVVPKTADALTIFVIMAFIFALLSWTSLAREVRGKVLSLRETDFIMAAKEMGASDARIIFRHLYPNCLSHIIVITTLTVPMIILAESFLSFLGIGIQEPLISWGLLMQKAQNIQTLGQQLWILSPVTFIIIAVLGFNFLGDGLRDAADPYAAR